MKRLAILGILVVLFCMTTLAQKGQSTQKVTRRAEVLVTPPATATVETWYTVAGVQYVNLQNGQQQLTPNVKVAFDGSDIYIQGLAYWFIEGWVKGSINGTTATFASGQFVGEDEYGTEYICGAVDEDTMTDVVFNYNAEEGTLECTTPYILENSSATVVNPYAYWVLPTFSKNGPENPTAISNIQNDANNGKTVIFNLGGQRLNTPQKGLNIINGRVVIIK